MKKILIIMCVFLINSITYAGLFSDSNGVINISSDIKGANILIDGVKKGVVGSGITAISVNKGAHKVSISKETQDWKYTGVENIFVSENSSVEIHITTNKTSTQYRLNQIEKQEKADKLAVEERERKYRLDRDKQRLNTFYRVKVKDSVSNKEVEEAMSLNATVLGIRTVGILSISEMIAIQTGKKQKFLKIFNYISPVNAMIVSEGLNYFAAYMPYRIALIEDKSGDRYLYTLDLKSIISDSVSLQDNLRKRIQQEQDVIFKIMNNGSNGDF